MLSVCEVRTGVEGDIVVDIGALLIWDVLVVLGMLC